MQQLVDDSLDRALDALALLSIEAVKLREELVEFILADFAPPGPQLRNDRAGRLVVDILQEVIGLFFDNSPGLLDLLDPLPAVLFAGRLQGFDVVEEHVLVDVGDGGARNRGASPGREMNTGLPSDAARAALKARDVDDRLRGAGWC